MNLRLLWVGFPESSSPLCIAPTSDICRTSVIQWPLSNCHAKTVHAVSAATGSPMRTFWVTCTYPIDHLPVWTLLLSMSQAARCCTNGEDDSGKPTRRSRRVIGQFVLRTCFVSFSHHLLHCKRGNLVSVLGYDGFQQSSFFYIAFRSPEAFSTCSNIGQYANLATPYIMLYYWI